MKSHDDKSGRQSTGTQQQKQSGNKQGQAAPREDARRNLSDQSGSSQSRSSTSADR